MTQSKAPGPEYAQHLTEGPKAATVHGTGTLNAQTGHPPEPPGLASSSTPGGSPVALGRDLVDGTATGAVTDGARAPADTATEEVPPVALPARSAAGTVQPYRSVWADRVELGPTPPGRPSDFRRCIVCGGSMAGKRSHATCCGAACRMRKARRQEPFTRSERLAAKWGLEARDFWRTPLWLFARLHAEFDFAIDCAANGPDDALLPKHITPAQDALRVSWVDQVRPRWYFGRPPLPAWAFVNPPFSRKGGRGRGLLAWVEKAEKERREGLGIVLICPSDTSTRYHQMLKRVARELRHPPRRVNYVHPDTGAVIKGNRGPSMIAVLDPGHEGPAADVYDDALVDPGVARG